MDWLLDALLPKHHVQLGLVRSGAVPLDSADPGLPTSPARPTTTSA
jgi:NADH dehydrogenase